MPLLPSCHVSCSKRDGTWVQQTPTLSRDSSARESERERERERERETERERERDRERERERDHSFVGYVFVVL